MEQWRIMRKDDAMYYFQFNADTWKNKSNIMQINSQNKASNRFTHPSRYFATIRIKFEVVKTKKIRTNLSATARRRSGRNVPSVSIHRHFPSAPPISIGNWQVTANVWHNWLFPVRNSPKTWNYLHRKALVEYGLIIHWSYNSRLYQFRSIQD